MGRTYHKPQKTKAPKLTKNKFYNPTPKISPGTPQGRPPRNPLPRHAQKAASPNPLPQARPTGGLPKPAPKPAPEPAPEPAPGPEPAPLRKKSPQNNWASPARLCPRRNDPVDRFNVEHGGVFTAPAVKASTVASGGTENTNKKSDRRAAFFICIFGAPRGT